VYEAEFRVLRPDGSTRWITGAARPATIGKERETLRLIGINYDITKRKEAEAEIKSLNENLEQLVAVRTVELTEINQELEAFTYTVSHDLRAPLRAIQGFSQALVEDYADQLDDTAREYIQAIETAALRMGNLIQDLLDYSRLSRAEIRLQAVDLEWVVSQVLNDLKSEIAERQADISVIKPLPTVWAHPVTLEQAVTNLLSNSIKFTAPGKQPFLRIWAEERNKSVRLWVEDHGIGIAPEHLERIFGVFERLHGIETYPGTGIGLAIVRRAAERMNGTFGVESEVEGGSRFWIELEKFEKTS
jgi:signal transduction histidine kinase